METGRHNHTELFLKNKRILKIKASFQKSYQDLHEKLHVQLDCINPFVLNLIKMEQDES